MGDSLNTRASWMIVVLVVVVRAEPAFVLLFCLPADGEGTHVGRGR